MAVREPSMEDILASIKRVIAEEKEIRAAAPPAGSLEGAEGDEPDDDVLELDSSMAASPAVAADLGPPLVEEALADSSRAQFEALASLAASAPPQPAVNPLEEMVREMLRPVLKQWLDEHLPRVVDEHVKREIGRITGRKV